jgi:peptidoglycan/xylan/chitin deacetylase (PgdA/CDA1 family)
MTDRTTVLAYHAVASCPASDDDHLLFVSPTAFEAQMEYLARRRQVVTLVEAVSGPRPRGRPAVAITFDDGYRSVLEHALPVLERFGFPATVFVPTRYIGDQNRWNPPSACPLTIMSTDELRDAEARGLAVESHGHAHLDLSNANEDEARDDLAQSVAILRTVTGRQPRFLAYPFATASPSAQRVAETLGFVAAFNVSGRDRGPFARGRVPASRLDPPWLFGLQTSGHYLALRHSLPTEWALSAARSHRGGPRSRPEA